ncbi:hypothetical protein [Rossellomorea aquimaris]|jgi:hypothetical protein|uniref:hypothetical protein n=1 Tax=Rossellomorea aquimaris TaxID=189382 RepID=UPI0011E8EAF4|nr:hypothetical protein [Rossellomorea aquimaris]TYS86207.1 hypothetical protein FZC88_18945 [Rossellomorea aquimaris]
MNKYALLSVLMVLISVAVFLILRGPNADLSLVITILGILSVIGIVFAVLSKKWLLGIMGVLTNGTVLVFVFFLLLANGIGG